MAPSADDLASFRRLKNDTVQPSMPTPPPIPADVKERFPSMAQWDDDFRYWAETQLGAKIIGDT